MNTQIANRFVELRKAKGLSQESLARELGVSKQVISQWEKAESSPDTDYLIALAKLYDISIDELLDCNIKINNDQADEKDVSSYQKKTFPFTTIIVLVYIIIGVFFHLWHPGWLVLFLVPLIESLDLAFKYHNPDKFAYPVFATFIFLCLGFFAGLWHPGWVVFLTIPVFYALIHYFKG